MAMEMPKPTAARSAISWPGLISPAAGRTMTITPMDAEHDGRDLAECHGLAEKAGGQDRGPDRHRELDRDHLAQRNQRKREEPADLRGIVNEVAPDVLNGRDVRIAAKPPWRRIRGYRISKPMERARLHDLKHIESRSVRGR